MVSHVLHKQPRLRVFRLAPEQFPDDGVAVAVHGCNDLVPAGMLGARYAQVVAIQRLVDHGYVVILRETVHQCRRHISWSGSQAYSGCHCVTRLASWLLRLQFTGIRPCGEIVFLPGGSCRSLPGGPVSLCGPSQFLPGVL